MKCMSPYLLALLLAGSLVACNGSDKSEAKATDTATTTVTTTETMAPAAMSDTAHKMMGDTSHVDTSMKGTQVPPPR